MLRHNINLIQQGEPLLGLVYEEWYYNFRLNAEAAIQDLGIGEKRSPIHKIAASTVQRPKGIEWQDRR